MNSFGDIKPPCAKGLRKSDAPDKDVIPSETPREVPAEERRGTDSLCWALDGKTIELISRQILYLQVRVSEHDGY